MFCINPTNADEKIEMGRDRVEIYTDKKSNHDGVVATVSERKIDLLKVFIHNLSYQVLAQDDNLEERLERKEDVIYDIASDLEVLIDDFANFINDYDINTSDQSIEELQNAVFELYDHYDKIETSSQSDRLANMKILLDFFNLKPSVIFMTELDNLIVHEIAYFRAEYLRIDQLIDSSNIEAKLESVYSDALDKMEGPFKSLYVSFMTEFKARDIPIDTILPLIIQYVFDDDEYASSMVGGFLLRHGLEVKSVIYEFIDSNEDLHKLLLILDDAADATVRGFLLDEIPKQLAHIDTLIQRFIDLPHHTLDYNPLVEDAVSLLVDFINYEVSLDDGILLERLLGNVTKELKWLSFVTDKLFDEDNVKDLFYDKPTKNTDELLYLCLALASDKLMDVVFIELYQMSQNIVKVIRKMPKTNAFVNNTLNHTYGIFDKTNYIANKVNEDVGREMFKNLYNIKDQEVMNALINLYIADRVLTEKVVDIYSEFFIK